MGEGGSVYGFLDLGDPGQASSSGAGQMFKPAAALRARWCERQSLLTSAVWALLYEPSGGV